MGSPKHTEDFRITAARKVLTQSEAADPAADDYDGARWHGILEATVISLLAVLDEAS